MHHSQIIAEGRIDKLKEITNLIVADSPCRLVSEPAPGMIMVRHDDPVENTPFYIGEVYVTSCEVEVYSTLGYGCVVGDDLERSFYGAVIDAAIGSGNRIIDEIEPLLQSEGQYIRQKHALEKNRISKTMVNFNIQNK